MVFQDTASSLNPRKRIRTTLLEAVTARGLAGRAGAARVDSLLGHVGLDAQLLGRYFRELSGGQRVGTARALAMEPSLLAADEPVSSREVSLQGQIINLLRALNERLGLTIVLISMTWQSLREYATASR